MSGKVQVGDAIMVYPSGVTSKVRGIQVHNQSVNSAEAGMRTAINFQGLDKDSVNRGEVLSSPNALKPSYMVDVHFHYLASAGKPLKNRSRVRFHTGTSEILGNLILLEHDELKPGETNVAQLRLDAPVAIVKGDHYVVRSYSPVRTVGGGASKKLMAITNNGQSTQTLQLIDVQQGKVLDNITVPKLWVGLKFSADEKCLYASGGNDNWILKYAIRQQKLVLQDSIIVGAKWPNKISPAGIDIDDQLLYVVTKDNNSLYVIDLQSKKDIQELKLPGEAYTCLLSHDKTKIYISCWGCGKLLTYHTGSRQLIAAINVGSNPNDICLSKNDRYLYVANANDNSQCHPVCAPGAISISNAVISACPPG